MEADLCLALLNHEFITSERCEDQVTYAKDTRTRTVAVMVDKAGLDRGMGKDQQRSSDAESSRQHGRDRVRELEAEVTSLRRQLEAAQAEQ